MSWFGHTFLVVVQEACLVDDDEGIETVDCPKTVSELVARCARSDRQVANYIAHRYADADLPELYGFAGVLPEADEDPADYGQRDEAPESARRPGCAW